MFYVSASTLRKREVLLLHILPTIIVLIVFISATMLSWSSARRNLQTEQQNVLNQQNSFIEERLLQRMSTYENILRGGVGLFQASSEVTRIEWRTYYNSFELNERYPGIQGLGYSKILPHAEKYDYEAKLRAEGIKGFRVFPSGHRDVYSSITYIEPMNVSNRSALGYDMYTEPIRREAMRQSAVTGKPAITGIVRLIQEETLVTEQPGFLMYLPIGGGSVESTVGYVYAPFRTRDLISNIVATRPLPGYEFKVTSSDSGGVVLYETDNYRNFLSNQAQSMQQQTNFELYGKSWKIHGIISPEVVNENIRTRPNSILVGGLLLSLLLAGFLFMLLGNRSKALARKEELSIQNAKDELLALASHQLRTPATGVKQYVGMLREGFVGKLTKAQKDIVEKAYQSNERQLSTINEMLVVARADAGHLKINAKPTHINSLLESIVEEYIPVIEGRGQKISCEVTVKELYVKGDGRYLRMAIENILSNASKYTYSNGSISVRLERVRNNAVISVSDTGVGVPKESYHLLFKKFSRIPNELTDQVMGSGIGLYLSKKIIESHSGRLEFDSEENVGTKVRIILSLSESSSMSNQQ